MTRGADIPHGPIALGCSQGGFLPQVGLHRRAGVFYQESSYSHLWLAFPFLVASVVFVFLPLSGLCCFYGAVIINAYLWGWMASRIKSAAERRKGFADNVFDAIDRADRKSTRLNS